jgi:hypothetical protein
VSKVTLIRVVEEFAGRWFPLKQSREIFDATGDLKAWPEQREIAKQCGFKSIRTAQRAIDVLEKMGRLGVDHGRFSRDTEHNRNRVNVYRAIGYHKPFRFRSRSPRPEGAPIIPEPGTLSELKPDDPRMQKWKR